MAGVDERNFERAKKILTGLVVASFVVVGFRTGVGSLSSELRDLADASWVQWVTTQHPLPSRNVWVTGRMGGTAKRFVHGGSGASWVDGTDSGAVLRLQVGCFVLSELWAVVRKRAEVGIRPSSIDTSLLTWQIRRTREASFRACGG
jgi:hypothetical protein